MNEQSSIAQLVELSLILLVVIAIMSALSVYAVRRLRSRRAHLASYADRPSLHFQGRGAMTLSADLLSESAYRIDYQLPEDALVKINLIERATGNDEVILIKSGKGIEGFAVSSAGDYLLRVEPLAEDVAWSFEIRPVGPTPAG